MSDNEDDAKENVVDADVLLLGGECRENGYENGSGVLVVAVPPAVSMLVREVLVVALPPAVKVLGTEVLVVALPAAVEVLVTEVLVVALPPAVEVLLMVCALWE
jgi:hypothetical protein